MNIARVNVPHKLLLGVGLVLIPLLHITTADLQGPLWFNTLKDLLHVPAYALLVIIVVRMFGFGAWKQVCIVAFVCLFTALLIEWSQTKSGGSLSRIDLYTSTIGSLSGALYLLAGSITQRLIVCAALLAASPLALDTWWTYYRSEQKLPELIPHPALFGSGLIKMHGSIEFSDQHLTIVFEDRPWPSLYRLEPPADWSGFEALDIDLELRTSKPIDLWLYAGSDHTHSVNKKYPLTPGRQHIRLPFANFDRHNVEQLKIYTEQQFAGAKLTLHSIRLR